jgi:hypothetical protein
MKTQGKKQYRNHATATTKTYMYCRVAAQRALKQAAQQEMGSFYFRMMAGTFAAFTVEAYLNHLGKQKVSDWKAIEGKLGPREKLLILKQLLRLSIDQSCRPFQTLDSMLKLRNALAHGKTATVSSENLTKGLNEESTHWPEPHWKTLCSLESVTRMVEDAEAMVRELSTQIGSKRDPFASLGHGWTGVGEVEEL